jgi:hypothetical protein
MWISIGLITFIWNIFKFHEYLTNYKEKSEAYLVLYIRSVIGSATIVLCVTVNSQQCQWIYTLLNQIARNGHVTLRWRLLNTRVQHRISETNNTFNILKL